MSDLPIEENNPVLITRKHYIATLLTRHFLESVYEEDISQMAQFELVVSGSQVASAISSSLCKV